MEAVDRQLPGRDVTPDSAGPYALAQQAPDQVDEPLPRPGDVLASMQERRQFSGMVPAAVATSVALRHGRGAATGRSAPGGILIGDAAAYDAHSGLVLGSLFRSVASDVAAVAEAAAPGGAGVLEAGCGPGHLSIRMARRHGLEVTGLDLDPAMIERARANADGAGEGYGRLVIPRT